MVNPSDPRALEAIRQHYHNNKEQYHKRNKIRKQEMRDWIDNEKNVPCMDCENSYPPYVMDLHHRDTETKVAEIGVLINRGSWSKLKEERDKCDVICSNCHRIRHYGSNEA